MGLEKREEIRAELSKLSEEYELKTREMERKEQKLEEKFKSREEKLEKEIAGVEFKYNQQIIDLSRIELELKTMKDECKSQISQMVTHDNIIKSKIEEIQFLDAEV